ncbi:MAG: hypothetical protein IRZ32_02985 [Solirubrobacteraceae bacterium]|nr:hypothetical protein [Solirubrobacteraceae bacterium]
MNAIRVYRDDGPLAALLGRLGAAIPLWPVALLLIGLAPGAVAVALEGDGASEGLAAACAGWLVLCGGLSSGRPHDDRLRWMVPSLVRLGEYGTIVWLCAIAGGAAPAGAFALLSVAAFRQYDLVYRLRTRGAVPPPWTAAVSLGWEGRVLLALVLVVAGLVPGALYGVAGALAVVLVGEAVHSWTSSLRVDAPDVYEDEEDEAA